MISLKNDVIRRLYIGNASTVGLAGLGTLNGTQTNGTSSGLQNGALQFATPTAQAAGAAQYLNETRVLDAIDNVDNWYNQYVAHTGIGTDFLQTAEQIKITADTFTEDSEGISLGIMSIADQVALGAEVRSYPGGSNGGIMYSVDDIKSGKAHPTVWMVGGVRYYSNRWMTAANVGKTGAAYLLNPNAIEYWVNANNDFRTTKFTDHLATSNQDADVGYIILESQFVVPNLLANGCTST